MEFDKNYGLWRPTEKGTKTNIITEILNNLNKEEEEETEEPEPDITVPFSAPDYKGKCVLTIQIENHAEYLKWKKYNPGRQWEYLVNFPAYMRGEYEFKNALEVEMIAKKIVQLLQMGFDVYSASWRLERSEEDESC